MSEVMAIVGDADMYHVDCAVKVYGDAIIDIATENVSQDAAEELTEEQRATLDSLSIVFDGSEDLTDETGQPHSCGVCLGYLVEDERPSDSPLARDILNLSAQYRDESATRVLSTLARYAREREHEIDTVIAETEEYSRSFRFQHGDKDTRTLAAIQALRLMLEWRKKWNAREIIKLHSGIGEYGERAYKDTEGNDWAVFDMRGYMDMWNDGDSECESCGKRLESHVYYCVWDNDGYCPDCVTVE